MARVRWLLAEHGWCGEAAAADGLPLWREERPSDAAADAAASGGVAARAAARLGSGALEAAAWALALAGPPLLAWAHDAVAGGASDGGGGAPTGAWRWPSSVHAAALASGWVASGAAVLGAAALVAHAAAAASLVARGRRGALRSEVLVRGGVDGVFRLLMRLDSTRYQWDPIFERGRVLRRAGPQLDVLAYQLRPPDGGAPLALQLLRRWQAHPGGARSLTACSTHSAPGGGGGTAYALTVTVAPVAADAATTPAAASAAATSAAAPAAAPATAPAADEASPPQAWSSVSMVVEITARSSWLGARSRRSLELAALGALPRLRAYLDTAPPLPPFTGRSDADADGGGGAPAAAAAREPDEIDRWLEGFDLRHADPAEEAAAHAWSEPPADGFRVRSHAYLSDRVKLPSAQHAFRLRRTLVLPSARKLSHVAAAYPLPPRPPGSPPLLLVVFQVPGALRLHLVLVWERDHAADDGVDARDLRAFERLLGRCSAAETVGELHGKLKIVPNVAEGGGIFVRKTVGNKPAIISNALKQAQWAGNGYVEVDIDIESSAVAKHILGVVKPLSQALAIDLAFVIEGQTEDELPERLLGAVRLHRINLGRFVREVPEPGE